MPNRNQVNAQFLTLNYKPYEGWGRHQQLVEDHLTFIKDSLYKVVLANPYQFPQEKEAKVIYMATFEADRLPLEFIEPANNALAIIVPDEWVKEVFIKSGITVPIYVVPEGVTNNTIYEPDHHPFTFLHFDYTSDHQRKGGDLVVEAFMSLFVNMPRKVRLILKGRDHRIPISRLYNNIEYIFQNYSQSQMDNLWSQTNCFVFPSRGEGFGLPPLEAITHGIPTIVTHGSAMQQFSHYGMQLAVNKKIPAHYDSYHNYGLWDEPDIAQLKELMLYTYEHYFEMKRRAVTNAALAWKEYNFERVAEKLATTINEIVAKDLDGRI